MNKDTRHIMPVTPSNTGPPPSRSRPLTRRDFISLVWKGLLRFSGLLGLGALWQFLSYRLDPAPPTRFDLGLAKSFPPGTRATVPEAFAVLQCTTAGFQAHSLICPHLGCMLGMTEEGFECPCHGSRFGANGELLHGPADRPMRLLDLETTSDGHLILDSKEG